MTDILWVTPEIHCRHWGPLIFQATTIRDRTIQHDLTALQTESFYLCIFIPFRSFHYHLRKVMLLVKLDLLSLNWFLFECSSKLALKCAPFPTIISHWTIFTSNWQTTSCNDVEFIAISCKVLIIATFNAKMLLKCCLNYEISLNKEINRNR